jgi:hypothetical protein
MADLKGKPWAALGRILLSRGGAEEKGEKVLKGKKAKKKPATLIAGYTPDFGLSRTETKWRKNIRAIIQFSLEKDLGWRKCVKAWEHAGHRPDATTMGLTKNSFALKKKIAATEGLVHIPYTGSGKPPVISDYELCELAKDITRANEEQNELMGARKTERYLQAINATSKRIAKRSAKAIEAYVPKTEHSSNFHRYVVTLRVFLDTRTIRKHRLLMLFFSPHTATVERSTGFSATDSGLVTTSRKRYRQPTSKPIWTCETLSPMLRSSRQC